MVSKQDIIDAVMAHIEQDNAVHQSLIEAVQAYEGDADKLLKKLEGHVKKTTDEHQVLMELANEL